MVCPDVTQERMNGTMRIKNSHEGLLVNSFNHYITRGVCIFVCNPENDVKAIFLCTEN